MEHEEYMRQALALAEEAEKDGEVPVGCVIVCKGEIVGRGRNRRETAKTAFTSFLPWKSPVWFLSVYPY